jgi:hypothetical protein
VPESAPTIEGEPDFDFSEWPDRIERYSIEFERWPESAIKPGLGLEISRWRPK